MTDYQPGELVDITIRGARVLTPRPGQPDSLNVAYAEPNPGVWAAVQFDHPDKIEVTRVAPTEWPPQPGDLWRDRQGTTHFGISYSPDYDDKADSDGIGPDGTRTILVASGGDESCRLSSQFYRPEYINQKYGRMTLVYREHRDQGGDGR